MKEDFNMINFFTTKFRDGKPVDILVKKVTKPSKISSFAIMGKVYRRDNNNHHNSKFIRLATNEMKFVVETLTSDDTDVLYKKFMLCQYDWIDYLYTEITIQLGKNPWFCNDQLLYRKPNDVLVGCRSIIIPFYLKANDIITYKLEDYNDAVFYKMKDPELVIIDVRPKI